MTAVGSITAASATTGANVAIPNAASALTTDGGTGGGLSHPNVQPTIVLPIIIKL